MSLSFNIFQILILFGSLNGLVLAGLILFKKRRRNFNPFLVAFILVFTLGSIKIVLQEKIPYFNYYLPVPLLYQFAFGPLLYLYLKSSLQADYKLKTSFFRYFLPCFLFDVCPAIFLFFKGPAYEFLLIQQLRFLSDVAALGFFGYYIWESSLLIKEYRLYDTNIATPVESWMRITINAAMLIGFSWLFYILSVVLFKGHTIAGMMPYYPIYILLSFCVYSVGVSGYHRPEIGLMTIPNTERKMLLSREDLLSKKDALVDSLNQTNYHRDENISLKLLSQKVGIPEKELSYIINVGFGKNFSDFINELRIDDFKRMVEQPENNKYNILGLAYQSGFNSKASFYRAFKKINHATPSEFYSNVKEANRNKFQNRI